jgi:quercetin dioxygenase-like cupin family protein
MKTHLTWRLMLAVALTFVAQEASAQIVAGAGPARPVQGDDGIFSMQVTDEPTFRVLRDFAEPGATRRMHNHTWAAYHVFVLVTGSLRLQIEGENEILVGPGEVVSIPGGATHTFTNIGTVPATIVEVFGKVESAPDGSR